MEFTYHIIVLVLGIVATVSIAYAAGAVRHAKALVIALVASLVIGCAVVALVLFVGTTLMGIKGEAVLGVLVVAVGLGMLSTGIGFFAILIIVVRRLKPSELPQPVARNISLVAGVISLLIFFFCLYQLLPILHSTSKLIDDVRGPRSKYAKYELIRRGDDALEAVMDVLEAAPDSTRAGDYVEVIGLNPSDKATEALFVLLKSPSAEVGAHAAARLGIRREKTALEPLLEFLEGDGLSDYHKAKAIKAITSLNEPSAVPRILAAVDPPGLQPGGGHSVYNYDSAYVLAMGALRHPEAYEALLELCSHPREEIRKQAIVQIGNYPCRRTALILIDLLDDPASMVRRNADWKLTAVTGQHWDPSGLDYSSAPSGELRSKWLEWMRKNGHTLPEEPSFEPLRAGN